MNFFLILQIFFDAVLLFGILFLFHFSVYQTQKKKEESDILKDVQVQEIRENLQELLMTLKQLGKEVSDNIQEQVNEAELKTENFKKVISKFQKDITKVTKLSDELNMERVRLEEKSNIVEVANNNVFKFVPKANESLRTSNSEIKKNYFPGKYTLKKSLLNFGLGNSENTGGVPNELVAEVCRLADSKMVINEIIQQTKLSRAEVQLILNLRVNRFADQELKATKIRI